LANKRPFIAVDLDKNKEKGIKVGIPARKLQGGNGNGVKDQGSYKSDFSPL